MELPARPGMPPTVESRSFPGAADRIVDGDHCGYTALDDTYYRAHFAHHAGGDEAAFAKTRPAYILGHRAGLAVDTATAWAMIERDLARAWTESGRNDWPTVSCLVRDAFVRASSLEHRTWRTRLADTMPPRSSLT